MTHFGKSHTGVSRSCSRYLFTLVACTFAFLAAPAAAAPPAKVQICHIPPGNPANFHTITISEKALSAHLAHGDVAGSCNQICDLLCSDNNVCTIDHGGDCEGAGCFPGADRPPVSCDDGNPCTEDELCHPTDGCANAPEPGNLCDDGDACTELDVCDDAGACSGQGIENCCVYVGDCNDQNACTNDSCDGVPENPSGTCSHSAVQCDDPDACTISECNEVNGECTSAPRACDDGLGCTNDGCDAATGCVHAPVDCLPGDACTTSSCAEPGVCFDQPLECVDDGVACTVELCDASTGCSSVPNHAACNDGNQCTADACDASSPFPNGCRHDAIAGCCNSDADCPQGQQCDESGAIPHCVPAQSTCVTASDHQGSGNTSALIQDCLQNGSCGNDRQCSREPSLAFDCVVRGDPAACDALDAFWQATGGCSICEDEEPGPSACPCWDGGPQSVPGINNLTELWQAYGPSSCVTDVCTDSAGTAAMVSRAECFSPSNDMTTGVVSNSNQGLVQCSVHLSSPALNVQATFPIGSPEGTTCLAEHDAFTGTIEFPPVPPGGTNVANPCYLTTP